MRIGVTEEKVEEARRNALGIDEGVGGESTPGHQKEKREIISMRMTFTFAYSWISFYQ